MILNIGVYHNLFSIRNCSGLLKFLKINYFFVFYNSEEYDSIKEECVTFSDFGEVLDYIIDIAEN